ncbi:hypothetical protein BGW36DRAFT_367397 [Talaromyces proteolyticus]|uniref:Uncharacterized protein n=1 Tax=Talaromyces proteolyticus TaxID=1131652 RepID=A0AAD4L1D7_9EURO|nr:uncharacterized protein BGW36DRAFT_367397 [Talaromyces proteolyticus]KAH8705344.1 hypothetical protein BGW36DRAFT_367397 [Talaromyces proteolyticus]
MPHSHRQNYSSWRHGESSSASSVPRNSHPLSLPLPSARYQGDGFDYRRPIMSTTSQTEDVIDLTNEPDSPPSHPSRPLPSRTQSLHTHRPRHHRPPRFGRNIMADIVDLDDEADQAIDIDPPSSPEVQFVRATVRPPSTPRRLLDVLNLRNAQAGYMSPHAREAFRQEIALRTRSMGRGRTSYQPTFEDLLFTGDMSPNIDLTVDLDYQAPGFHIHEPTPPTPPPSYKPPSPVPEGFTRTVTDDDVVICPNCDHELGTGEGLEQQVWVAKPCGHVRSSIFYFLYIREF